VPSEWKRLEGKGLTLVDALYIGAFGGVDDDARVRGAIAVRLVR